MTVISIETAMAHLRLDEETDKSLVEGYLAGAEDTAMQFLNRKFYLNAETLNADVEAGNAGERPMVITPSIQSAVLIILAGLYENRGDSDGTGMPKNSRWLLDPYRIDIGT